MLDLTRHLDQTGMSASSIPWERVKIFSTIRNGGGPVSETYERVQIATDRGSADGPLAHARGTKNRRFVGGQTHRPREDAGLVL